MGFHLEKTPTRHVWHVLEGSGKLPLYFVVTTLESFDRTCQCVQKLQQEPHVHSYSKQTTNKNTKNKPEILTKHKHQ